MLILDHALVARIEAASAAHEVAVAAHLSGAVVVPMAGGYAVLLGAGRYVNRAFGLGFAGAVTHDDLAALEAASIAAGVPAEIEACPWADASLFTVAGGRGYAASWFRTQLARRCSEGADHTGDDERRQRVRRGPDARDGVAVPFISTLRSWDEDRTSTVQVSQVDDAATLRVWQDTIGADIVDAERRAISDEYSGASRANPATTHYIARIDGAPVGVARLSVVDGVGLLGAMATIPSARGRGVQSELIRHRLNAAAYLGCDVAVATTVPAGTSERNLRRAGFEVVCTKVGLRLPPR